MPLAFPVTLFDPLRDTRVGRRQRDAIKLLNVDKIIEIAEKVAADLVTQLNSRMEDQFS